MVYLGPLGKITKEYLEKNSYIYERQAPIVPRPELPKITKLACEYCGRRTSEEICPSCGAPTTAFLLTSLLVCSEGMIESVKRRLI